MMEWAPDSAPSDRSKAQRTEQGKGRPGPLAPSNKPHWRRAGGKGRRTDGPHQTHMIKAGWRSTALKILRQDYSWVLFVQLPLLFAAAQKWKKTLEEGRTTTALRTTLFGCLIQMLHTGLKDIGSEGSTPFKMAEGRALVLSKVVPSTREPGSGRDQVSAAAHQAAGSTVECATADNAALHDTSIPRNQAPHGQHDRNHHLSTRCLQPHRRTSESVGVPGDNDGPDGVTSHWPSAPTRLAQAITGCRACATSISRLLLIKLLNSSNTCYINASVRAWLYAVSHLQVADILKYGTGVEGCVSCAQTDTCACSQIMSDAAEELGEHTHAAGCL